MTKDTDINPNPPSRVAAGSALPAVMVLEYEPSLTCSVWKDYYHRSRTMNGLLKLLRSEVKAWRFVAYRLISVHRQVYGVEPNAKVSSGD